MREVGAPESEKQGRQKYWKVQDEPLSHRLGGGGGGRGGGRGSPNQRAPRHRKEIAQIVDGSRRGSRGGASEEGRGGIAAALPARRPAMLAALHCWVRRSCAGCICRSAHEPHPRGRALLLRVVGLRPLLLQPLYRYY
eukprot:SAG31_NODE_414_length_15953_cov_2.982528_6_plen_138_part_00